MLLYFEVFIEQNNMISNAPSLTVVLIITFLPIVFDNNSFPRVGYSDLTRTISLDDLDWTCCLSHSTAHYYKSYFAEAYILFFCRPDSSLNNTLGSIFWSVTRHKFNTLHIFGTYVNIRYRVQHGTNVKISWVRANTLLRGVIRYAISSQIVCTDL